MCEAKVLINRAISLILQGQYEGAEFLMERARDKVDLMVEMVTGSQAKDAPAQQVKDIEVTDQMASAFNQAICDDAMNDQDIEDVKSVLRAAISHLQPLPLSLYELEIARLVSLNDSLLANERRMLDRMRTLRPSPAVDISKTENTTQSPRITDHPETILSNSSQWSERVTEQDAREIINSYNMWWSKPQIKVPGTITDHDSQVFPVYMDDEGRALLNKLNANAVAEVRQERALIGHWNATHAHFQTIELIDGLVRGSYQDGTPVYIGSAPLQAAAIPEGWKIVPIEPTAGMCQQSDRPMLAKHTYKAMLSAAPKPAEKDAG